VPNFILKCNSCSWLRLSKGRSDELSDLKEIASSCSTCGKPRLFICPTCGNKVKLFKVKNETN